MNRAYLSLGSNIDPEQNLAAAVRLLSEQGTVTRVSRVWESAPVGYAEQPRFLNAAVLLLTELSARALRLHLIAEVEGRLGRRRDPGNKNAPRTIDIDIALFNQDVLDIDHRHIPDPDLLERAFVAVPVSELEPDYIHPETKQTLSSIADTLRAGARAGTLEERPDVALIPANG